MINRIIKFHAIFVQVPQNKEYKLVKYYSLKKIKISSMLTIDMALLILTQIKIIVFNEHKNGRQKCE